MPSDGPTRRIYGTQTIRVSTVVEAPWRYVYAWCTDFRDDDGRWSRTRPRPRFRTLRISPRRVVRIRLSQGTRDGPLVAVDLVRLDPPRRWHTDQIDETDLASVDYVVVPLGSRRTRVDLRVVERWTTPKFPRRSEYAERVRAAWQRYGSAVERRFRSGRPPRG